MKKREARRHTAPAAKPLKLTAGAEQPPILDVKDAPEGAPLSTFDALGLQLPIGYLQGGQLHRAFAFKRFGMREERELGALKAKASQSMAEFVIVVLAHMLTALGPWTSFQDLSEAERRLIVGSMFVGDVHYMFVALRIHAIGKEIAFDLKCPACRHKWHWTGDLSQTDVAVAEDVNHLTWRHPLRDGLPTPRGTAQELILQPPRWHSMVGLRAAGGVVNGGDVKLKIIASAVRHPVGMEDFSITPDLLEELSKFDLETLSASVDREAPGPDLDLDATCPQCAAEFSHALNWSWDFFFTASSL